MAEKTEIEAAISHAKEPGTLDVRGMPIITIPPGWKVDMCEELAERPLRNRSRPVFSATSSLCVYIGEHQTGEEPVPIYAHDTDRTIEAVLDAGTAEKPGHAEHRPRVKLELSPEWEVWKSINGKHLSRKEFTRFLERNLDYITGDFSGAKLLQMCRDVRIKGAGDLTITEDVVGGERRLNVEANTSAAGMAAGDYIPFPEELSVSLRVFKRCKRYDFAARLRWDISKHEMTFHIDLLESEIVEEGAFLNALDQFEEECSNYLVNINYILYCGRGRDPERLY